MWVYSGSTQKIGPFGLFASMLGVASFGLVPCTLSYVAVSVAVRYSKRATIEVFGRATLMFSTLLVGLPLAMTGRGLVSITEILSGTTGLFTQSADLYARWLKVTQTDPVWLAITVVGCIAFAVGGTHAVAFLRLFPVHEAHVSMPSDLTFLKGISQVFPATLRPFVVKDLRIWLRDRKRWANTLLSVSMMALLLVLLFRLMGLPQGAYRLGGMLIPVIGGFYLTVMQTLPLVHQDKGFIPTLQLSTAISTWWVAKLLTLFLITLPFSLLFSVGSALAMGIPLALSFGVALVTGGAFALTALAAAVSTMDPTTDEDVSARPTVLLAGAVLAALLFTTIPFALYWSTWSAEAKLVVTMGTVVFWAWVMAGSVVVTLHRLRRFAA